MYVFYVYELKLGFKHIFRIIKIKLTVELKDPFVELNTLQEYCLRKWLRNIVVCIDEHYFVLTYVYPLFFSLDTK